VKKRESLAMLGGRIRQLRIQRGFSQEKLAELADLNRNYVGDVERGERNVAAINILRIMRALRVTPSELFEPVTADVLRKLRL
jgi:transcriptional regulator with XRE-family HTH domain